MEARSSVFQAAHEHLSRPLWTPPGEHGMGCTTSGPQGMGALIAESSLLSQTKDPGFPNSG